MTAKPTVGRVVHFYTTDTSKHFNGQGEGPYPALITQVWSGSMANLKVFHYGGEYDEGSVSERADAAAVGDTGRFWIWPPRE